MATRFGGVSNTTAQKFIDALFDSIKDRQGALPSAAPAGLKDGNGKAVTDTTSTEVKLEFRTNPDGTSAFARISVIGSKAFSREGEVDLVTLAAKLV